MKLDFHKCSYLAQVRRLRELASTAVARYPVQVQRIHFIHHGENTTFRIDGRGGRKYLLRIHRNDYHTRAAIQEEIAWLAHLSQAGLSVPKPLRSKRGEWIESVAHPDIPSARNCSMFQWIEGRFIDKSLSPKHLYQVGQTLAGLQAHTPLAKVKHRQYWTAEGLVGENAKFGSIEALADTRPKQQKLIQRARKLVFRKLSQYERAYPKRQGLIHADLHFGNILSLGDQLGAIDFDDCGFGFHAYDLVIPLLSAEGILGEKRRDELPEFKAALLEGFRTQRSWDQADDEIFPYLVAARKLAMLGWLNSRSDNPRLKKHLKGAVERCVKYFNDEHGLR